MKVLKWMVWAALCAVCMSHANARDRVDIDININGYDYVAPQITHYPNTVYYSRTPKVIYYSVPEAVQIVPIITTQRRVEVNRYHGREQFYSRNYYKDWNEGWRQNSGRGQFYREREGDRCVNGDDR